LIGKESSVEINGLEAKGAISSRAEALHRTHVIPMFFHAAPDWLWIRRTNSGISFVHTCAINHGRPSLHSPTDSDILTDEPTNDRGV
jgi:hypothetical protein